MMGQHDGRKELFSFSIDLDERIRKNHPLRKIPFGTTHTLLRKQNGCF